MRPRRRRVRRERRRAYGRGPGELRPTTIEPGFMRTATGSALISVGETRVICTASAQESVPRWMAGRGSGLGDGRVRDAAGLHRRAQAARCDAGAPRRAHGRDPAPDRALAARRDRLRRRSANARSTSTATCCRPTAAPAAPRSPGAYVALALACARLRADGKLERSPLTGSVAAVSCGIVDGRRAARPRLLRGLDRGGRRERRDDRRRRPHRGAGDGRAHAALARASGRAARARRRRDRASAAPAGRSDGRRSAARPL